MKLLEALFNWTGYKVNYIYEYHKGRYSNVNFEYRARKYSPVFWIYCIFTYPYYWFWYGYSSTVQSIKDEFKYKPSTWIDYYHPPGSTWISKRVRNFVKVYAHRNV